MDFLGRSLVLISTVMILVIIQIQPIRAQEPDIIAKFEKRTHSYEGTTIPYRLFVPENDDSLHNYPLVLALHGAGERGTDNELPMKYHRLATSWADSINQVRFPCYVVVPQCPVNERWVDNDWGRGFYRVDDLPISNELATVGDILDSLTREFPLDTNRFYVTGLSMGGYGTWDLITRFPHRFAAAIPMSGGGDSTKASALAHIPLWVFHGQKDTTVPANGSRQMMTALERTGLHCVYTDCNFNTNDCTGLPDSLIDRYLADGAKLLYTEYKNKGHVIWAESYDDPRLFPWVFSRAKVPATHITGNNDPGTIKQFRLYQNFPNPCNPITTIRYTLDRDSRVTISVFNVNGQRVAILCNEQQKHGNYSVHFNGSTLVSGVYFYQITVEGKIESKKMVLVR